MSGFSTLVTQPRSLMVLRTNHSTSGHVVRLLGLTDFVVHNGGTLPQHWSRKALSFTLSARLR